MNIDSKTMIPISEVNQNFSSAAKIVDQYGSAVILKNNTPKYIILEFSRVDDVQNADNETVLLSSEKLLAKNIKVYKELAK